MYLWLLPVTNRTGRKMIEAPKRKRGRPKGSKNKVTAARKGSKKATTAKREQEKQAADNKNKGGRPSVITEEKRKTVIRAAEKGLPEQFIADLIGVALKTLKKNCQKELELGYANACDAINKLTWDLAEAGNAQALLHLRRVMFGEHDTLHIKHEGEQSFVMKIGEA